MRYCALPLLLGSLFIHVHPGSTGPCDVYQNMSDPWRNRGFTAQTFPGFPMDDGFMNGNLTWWRLTGIGGDRILTGYIGLNYGGTTNPIYLINSLPTTQYSTTPTVVTARVYNWYNYDVNIQVALCPGGFYVYQLKRPGISNAAYVTYHTVCVSDSCGPLAVCGSVGDCGCVSGYKIPALHLPSDDSYGCQDVDECVVTPTTCGVYSNCTNTPGSYNCSCQMGFTPLSISIHSPNCIDIDECLAKICGDNGKCVNSIGSYSCICNSGYRLPPDASSPCQDIDECLNATICGPYSNCTNTPGAYTCACDQGFEPTKPTTAPSAVNICKDIDECTTVEIICGPAANCTNTIGAYFCTCYDGYRKDNPDVIAGFANPCKDINECAETPGLCGPHSLCTNVPGTFHCSCLDGFYPTTGVVWQMGISVCQSVPEILKAIVPPEGQTKEMTFLKKTNQQLQNNSDHFLPEGTVTNSIYAALEVSGVGNGSKPAAQVSVGGGDGATGSMVLQISERLVSAMVKPTLNNTNLTVQTDTMEISVQAVGPKANYGNSTPLFAMGNTMEINLQSLANNNNGSATAVFMSVSGMEDLLSQKYFQSENYTEMYSDVLTAILPKTNNTQLSEPVNFTIYHKKRLPDSGMVTCVYWQDVSQQQGGTGQQQEDTMRWSVEGCWVAFSDENHTVCSCSHLSTFALILQIGEPPADDPFLDWLNRVLVCIGLIFFALAILTFLLCSWNPKINNTARLHLCICLSLTQLLLLFNTYYVGRKLVCSVMAGLLHFLVVGSFVWMLLEALQLHLLVRRLSKVQVIQRDGLPKPLLYLIGYGIPVVIVGVSAWVKPSGYGGTQMCWLTRQNNFVWALTGPVIAILAMNWVLFGATLWSLRLTLVNMKSGVSSSSDTRIVVFKILAQFVILGCTWILGLYQNNKFFQYLFVLLNSQQGTFLYIVHCLLNKEVREEYRKFLTCSFDKPPSGGSVREVPSVSEDMDRPDEKKKSKS